MSIPLRAFDEKLKNNWTKISKLWDRMDLDKTTPKWMLNLCLCRWKYIKMNPIIGQGYWCDYLKFHTTQAFVLFTLSWELPAFTDQPISALCSKQVPDHQHPPCQQGWKICVILAVILQTICFQIWPHIFKISWTRLLSLVVHIYDFFPGIRSIAFTQRQWAGIGTKWRQQDWSCEEVIKMSGAPLTDKSGW